MANKGLIFGALSGALVVGMAGVTQAAADTITYESGKPTADGYAPKFAVIHRSVSPRALLEPSKVQPTWTFSYSYGGVTYNETFIGAPVAAGTKTTVPVYIVPIAMVYGTTSENPDKVTENGVNVIKNVVNSPIFKSSVHYVQGGTDLGKTQYVDAFQRGNLWGTVKGKTGYHVLLGKPVVKPLQTFTVPAGEGTVGNPFGVNVIVANINWFDPQATALIAKLKIPSNALPIFIATNTYLSDDSGLDQCCIGGYHSTTGIQPYAFASYIPVVGTFSQDVSALSHEIGEWMDDPNTNNPVPPACGAGAVLEVGDPLENNADYGDYSYSVGGVTWHLQDLVWLPYFGASTSTSANGWSSFQGETLPFCSAGG